MNRELRRLSMVIMAMFASLFVASTVISFGIADSLNANPRNVRTLYDSYKTKRGAILVAGQPVAYSVPVGDTYHYQRTYSSKIYSAVTGFYSNVQGTSGIESVMNSYLTGKNSSQFFEQVNAVLSGNPVSGASVELTINPKVQQAAWDALGNLKGAVVAIEPSTGKILAMVSKPGFDANRLAVHNNAKASATYTSLLNDPSNPLINKAISGTLYAPGSVFKIIVASAALNNGYKPTDTFPNPAKFRLPGTSTYIYNSGEGKCGGKPRVSIADALRWSCNIPFAQLGIALGQDKIRAQAELFGFGKNLSIPLTVTPSTYPTGMDNAQTGLSAFGQFDDRVSPLQIAMVSAAVANGGVLMKPNLISYVQSSTLSILEQPSPSVLSQPLTTDVAAKVRAMMVNAVANGVSTNGKIPGVTVAGKTGTAQNGGSAPYTLWFTGFAPAENPKVAVAVVIEDGGGMGQRGFGNLLAAPVARKVMEAVLNK
ncbi:MAG: peptidoglycan D,D-transpeptidase FtsI family protein [Micrococcales bacterium]